MDKSLPCRLVVRRRLEVALQRAFDLGRFEVATDNANK